MYTAVRFAFEVEVQQTDLSNRSYLKIQYSSRPTNSFFEHTYFKQATTTRTIVSNQY